MDKKEFIKQYLKHSKYGKKPKPIIPTDMTVNSKITSYEKKVKELREMPELK